MQFGDAFDMVFAYGQSMYKGDYKTVGSCLTPIWKEISDLRAQVEELQYQLRVEKAKNV